MFKRKKKKTGIETPEYRCPVPPPPIKPPTPEAILKQRIINLCGQVAEVAGDIVKTMNESGFEKPTLVIKLFSDHTCTVYVNEENDEINYIGEIKE